MKICISQPRYIFEEGQRANQEDYIWPLPETATCDDRLFIVCDGMGGHDHGEMASSTFANGLAEYFSQHVSDEDVVDDDVLHAAIAHAYTELDAVDDGNYRRMGTTLTMLCFHKSGVLAAHIGDSRIYHLRPGRGLLYVSRDHSLVFDLYRSGAISLEEMKTSSNKNVITRAVQPGEDLRTRPDIVHITDIEQGDYFYLCSDGMLEQMGNDELYELLSSDESDEEKIERLIRETKANRDNHSAYLIRVTEVSHEPDDPYDGGEEERSTAYNALNMRPVQEAFQPFDDLEGDDSNDSVSAEYENVSARGDIFNGPLQAASPDDSLINASLGPMDPMSPSRSAFSRLLPLAIFVILAFLVAVGVFYWNLKEESRKTHSDSIPSKVRSSPKIKPIESALLPQDSFREQESVMWYSTSYDNQTLPSTSGQDLFFE